PTASPAHGAARACEDPRPARRPRWRARPPAMRMLTTWPASRPPRRWCFGVIPIDDRASHAHRVLGESRPLGEVRLEHQPEAALRPQPLDFRTQFLTQRRIVDLVEQHVDLVTHV